MAFQWLHVYTTDHGDSGACVAYSRKSALVLGIGPIDVPTMYKNLRFGVAGYRSSRCLAMVYIGSAPYDVEVQMSATSPFTSSWWNEFGKYVWAHQSFHITSLPTANTGNRTDFNIELAPTTSRSMGIGEQIFVVIEFMDMANAVDALNFEYWLEYDYKEVTPAP